MKTYFVSRHAGAQEWAQRNGFENAEAVAHFDPSVVEPGDMVIGTLPVNLAEQVCQRGGRYFHLSLQVPQEMRGVELNANQMEELGASVREFIVQPVQG